MDGQRLPWGQAQHGFQVLSPPRGAGRAQTWVPQLAERRVLQPPRHPPPISTESACLHGPPKPSFRCRNLSRVCTPMLFLCLPIWEPHTPCREALGRGPHSCLRLQAFFSWLPGDMRLGRKPDLEIPRSHSELCKHALSSPWFIHSQGAVGTVGWAF